MARKAAEELSVRSDDAPSRLGWGYGAPWRYPVSLSTKYVLAFCLVAFTSIAPSQAANVAQGKVLARTYCMKCHSIDKVSPSPLREAPPFRE
jgi:mono/diheme cytochrome c family protein